MKNLIIVAVISLVLAAAIGGYFYWQHAQPKPEPVLAQAPPPPPPAPPVPEVRQVLAVPAATPPLPSLAGSDDFVLDALAGLINNPSLTSLFYTERIVHRIVATIDNLPGRRAPMSVMPVGPVPGKFITTGTADTLSMSSENAARYLPYVKIAEAINPKKLVGLYVRLYPLFQQAYENLGYPKKYFNDRLIVVLDDLLAAPDIKDPVKLVQPKVYYQYADPDLEARSIGQRILMRTGGKNEAIVKTWLHEIRQELVLHMHDTKIVSAG